MKIEAVYVVQDDVSDSIESIRLKIGLLLYYTGCVRSCTSYLTLYTHNAPGEGYSKQKGPWKELVLKYLPR